MNDAFDDNVGDGKTNNIMNIETSSVDKRQYKHLKLGGVMDVVVISDPATDKSSAAMDIGIGQLCDDPNLYQGIAHFLEHMLFIGTKKYPVENAYDSFLTANGGSSNAFTDLEHTCYYFDVQSDQLEGAFDRFAQCFISPLFTKAALEREVLAVDSEHAKNLMQDQWRMYQLSKSKLVEGTNAGTGTCLESIHPFGSFGSGNAKTLPAVSSSVSGGEGAGDGSGTGAGAGAGDVGNVKEEDDNKDETAEIEIESGTHIRSQLVDFFQKYYRKSLQIYKLVILGRESIEDLEAMVNLYFSELIDIFENENDSTTITTTKDTILQELYPGPTSWNVPQRLHVVPISKVHSMDIQFPIREIHSLWRSKPTRYISHLIGHEGKGSLLSLLKSKHYVTELYADDSSKSCHDFSIFTIHMEMTDLGLQYTNDIVSMVFAYIDLIKNNSKNDDDNDNNDSSSSSSLSNTSSLKKWIHVEAQTVSEMQFRFLSQRNPMDYVSSVSGFMQKYPPPFYLSGPYKTIDWDPHSIEECLQALVPDNMLLLICSPTFDTTATDTATDTTTNTTTSTPMEEEPWYGTNYLTIEPNEVLLNTWKAITHEYYPQLQLPEVNDMIPTDFSLLTTSTTTDDNDGVNVVNVDVNDSSKEKAVVGNILLPVVTTTTTITPKDKPQCIHEDSNIRLWYKPDNVFDMPKVNIMIRLTSGQGQFSPDQSICAQLLTELVSEHCNEFSYLATMAGLYCDISPCASGIELQISGYNHKAHVLAERLVDTVMDLLIVDTTTTTIDSSSDDLFDRCKFKIEQALNSFLVGQPYQHCIYGGDLVLENSRTTIQDKMNTLKGITVSEVMNFGKGFLKHCRLDALVHGNVSAQHAYDITTMVWKKTHSTTTTSTVSSTSKSESANTIITRAPLEKRVVQLVNDNNGSSSSSSSYLYRFAEFNEANTNSSVEIVLQMGALDDVTNSTLSLFNALVKEPAYNQLRTEEQLGYIVHVSVKTNGDNIKGLLLLIQSDSFQPDHVEERIELFLNNFRTKLVDMSESDFQTFVDATVASFLEKNKNLGEESSRYWHVILNKTYDFSRYQKLADHVKKLKKVDILRFYDKYVAANAPLRQKLCVHVVAKHHDDDNNGNKKNDDDDNEKKIAATVGGETEEMVEGAVEDEEDQDQEKNDSSETNKSLSLLSTTKVIRIEDPVDFRRSMPLYPMPPNAPVNVVDVGIKK